MWEAKQDTATVPSAFGGGSGKALFKVVAPEPVALPTAAQKGQLFKRGQKAPVFSAGAGAAAPAPAPAPVPAAASPPAPPPAAPASSSQSVGDWVDEIGMSKYKDAICGYAGELDDLATMTDADVDELVTELGMPVS